MTSANAYADESGDTGYLFEAGSSSRFVLTVLLPLEPETLVNQVLAARRQLNKPETFEFHFNRADARVRQIFFEYLAPQKFHWLAAVVHKTKAPPDLRAHGKAGLYGYVLTGLALRAPFPLATVKLNLDGSGGQKAFLQTVKLTVREACRVAGRREQNFKDIRVLNSTHPLIQCADMLTGAFAAQVETGQAGWLNPLLPPPGVWWEETFA